MRLNYNELEEVTGTLAAVVSACADNGYAHTAYVYARILARVYDDYYQLDRYVVDYDRLRMTGGELPSLSEFKKRWVEFQ